MSRTIWQDLVVENPMLIEIHRFRRRFLTFSAGNSLNSAVLALILVCYAGLVLLVVQAKGDIPPLAVVMIQTGVLTLFAPGMLHGAIAGERERRSWDLLLVAPISKAQIVVGKFIGALAALGVAATFFLLPILISAIAYRRTNWNDLIEGEAVSLTFGAAVCGLTMLFSARVKRPFMALGASLGTLAVLMIVLPSLIGIFGNNSLGSGMVDVFYLHPFIVLTQIMQISEDRGDYSSSYRNHFVSDPSWGWPQAFIYLAFAIILVTWAAKTLIFAENEVKFIPKGNKADA